MIKGSCKDAVVVLDSYTLHLLGEFPSVNIAAEELKLKANSIRHSICFSTPAYNCYWVYKKVYPTWSPAKQCHRKNRFSTTEELEKLRTQTAM